MNNLQILSVTIKRFRGFPSSVTIPFTRGLTVIYAANGTGKSTICQAVEWLFTGGIADISSKAYSCLWGEGDMSVSAHCELNGVPLCFHRTEKSLFTTNLDGSGKKSLTETSLLQMITPNEIGVGNTASVNRTRRDWFRHSRWLYSNSLSMLVDDAEAEQRRQIFANILGYGHLANQQKSVQDYLRYLPSIQSFQKQHDEIALLKKDLLAHAAPPTVIKENADKKKQTLITFLNLTEIPEDLKTILAFSKEEMNKRHAVWNIRSQALADIITRWDTASSEFSKEPETRQLNDKLLKSLKDADITLDNLRHKAAEYEALVKNHQENASKIITAQDNRPQNSPLSVYVQSIAGRPLLTLNQQELRDLMPESRYARNTLHTLRKAISDLVATVSKHEFILDHRKEWEAFIKESPEKKDVSLYEMAVKDEEARLKVLTEQFNELSGLTEQLYSLGKAVVSQSSSSQCPLCRHDWKEHAELESQIARVGASLAPQLKVMDDALVLCRSALDDKKKAHAKCLEDFKQRLFWQKQIATADSDITTCIDKHALHEKIAYTPGVEIKTNYLLEEITHIDQAIALLRLDDEVNRVLSLLSSDSLPENAGTFQKVDYIEKALPERIVIEQELIAQNIKLLNDTNKQLEDHKIVRENIAIRLRKVEQTLSSITLFTQEFRRKWELLLDNKPVQKDMLLKYQHQHEEEEKKLSQIHQYINELEAYLETEEVSKQIISLQNREAELARIIEIGKQRKTIAENALTELTRDIELRTSQTIESLMLPASELFSRMHANEVYKGFDVADRGHFNWRATTETPIDDEDKELVAEHYFSQGQRQDLALSLFLSRAKSLGGTFFMDEPVAHLDDLNRVAMADIFRMMCLADRGLSLVLTTASDPLRRHLRQKFSSLSHPGHPLFSVVMLKGSPLDGIDIQTSIPQVSRPLYTPSNLRRTD
ncbi:MAG: AAA family ATPase [Hafnia sp.]|uniref:AAA family ATPase n=1 Tax=Hafnia sp. TaxID=1873498 RepID=UPI002FC69B8A